MNTNDDKTQKKLKKNKRARNTLSVDTSPCIADDATRKTTAEYLEVKTFYKIQMFTTRAAIANIAKVVLL